MSNSSYDDTIIQQARFQEKYSERKWNLKQSKFQANRSRIQERYIQQLINIKSFEQRQRQYQYSLQPERRKLSGPPDALRQKGPKANWSDNSANDSNTDEGSDYDYQTVFENLHIHKPSQEEILKKRKEWEKQQRIKEVERLLQGDYPELADQFIKGDITLAQLKQRYFSQHRGMHYHCYDDIKQELGLKKDYEASDQSSFNFTKKQSQRPVSLHRRDFKYFNSKTKIPYTPSIIHSTDYSNERRPSTGKQRLRSRPQSTRQVSYSNQDFSYFLGSFAEPRKPNLKHGGKLSAQFMQNYLRKNLEKSTEEEIAQKPKLNKKVCQAVKTAQQRIKEYKSKPQFHHGRLPTHLLKRNNRNYMLRDVKIVDTPVNPNTQKMGVPTFFRWLCQRYPNSIVDASEQILKTELPEFDNFYLDMNGIIHPCCNPPEGPKPQSEAEMFENVFKYIDRLVQLIRPKRLLFMAIDGVAPRAKMNQQRSRRYFKVHEEKQERFRKQQHIENLRQQGIEVEEEEPQRRFDSNVITPGTEFMARLAGELHKYILTRLRQQRRNLTVIFSDSNNPGEGEHKILEFIRNQRQQQNYNPNTKHCIYGADADLIMLSLITHEAHFYIIRESVMDFSRVTCRLCGKTGHFQSECNAARPNGRRDERIVKQQASQFQICKIPVLREYLYYEFEELQQFHQFSFERVIDDFIFFCFFVGNDFLPHLPGLSIRDGAIDGLIFLYIRIFHKLGGYLTENGTVVLYRVDILLRELAKFEDEYFKQKQEKQDYFNRRNNQIRYNSRNAQMRKNEEAANRVSQEIEKMLNDENDFVRFGEDGWKIRYYQEKFSIGQEQYQSYRRQLHRYYMEGVSWVFQYYYNGVPSWDWYYPFHYAPFASDLYGSHELTLNFQLGEPVSPLTQLMSVMPPQSSHALPQPLRWYMESQESTIKEFYPDDIECDLNGKRYQWESVVLLPFIDMKKLRNTITPIFRQLTEAEQERNSQGEVLLYCKTVSNEIFVQFVNSTPQSEKYQINLQSANGQLPLVKCWVIENRARQSHKSEILEGAVQPDQQVDKNVFQSSDRRGFNGFYMINLIKKHLNLSEDSTKFWIQQRTNPNYQFTDTYNTRRFLPEPQPVTNPDLIANVEKLNSLLAQLKK